MKLIIFGGTGEIGRAVVEAALDADHEVTTFVRSPEKLGGLRARVRVIQGDLGDADALAGAIAGQQAVINAIGSSPERAELDVPAMAMRRIIEAMEKAGVRRLVGLAGGAVNVPGERKPLGGRISSALVRLFARNVVDAKQREFEVVRRSQLDWTMVRPPRVTAGGATGRVEIGATLHGFQVSRGDVAAAMLELACGKTWLREAPYVFTGRTRA